MSLSCFYLVGATYLRVQHRISSRQAHGKNFKRLEFKFQALGNKFLSA